LKRRILAAICIGVCVLGVGTVGLGVILSVY